MRHADGHWVWLRARCELVSQAGELGPHLIGIAVDITEQKNLVEKTVAADLRLRDAIETIPEAFVLWDADNRLVLCNSNFQELHDLPDEAMTVGASYESVVAAGRKPVDSRSVDIEGATALVDLMGRASTDTSLYLLQAMKSKDRKLSEAVEKRFFLFDAIPLVPDDVLPQAVRGMPSAIVIQALTGAPQDLQRKVLMAFPEQARPGLVNSLRASKAESVQVEDARRQVVARFQALARQGKIDLKKISDAWQAQGKSSQPAA